MRLVAHSDDILSTPVNRVEESQARIIKSLILVVVMLVLALIGVVVESINAPRSETIIRESEVVPPGYLPSCQSEDSDNCYWDAQTMGNGTGNDSVVLVP